RTPSRQAAACAASGVRTFSEAHLDACAERPAAFALLVLLVLWPVVPHDQLADQPATQHRLLPLEPHPVLADIVARAGLAGNDEFGRQQAVVAVGLEGAEARPPCEIVGLLGDGHPVLPPERERRRAQVLVVERGGRAEAVVHPPEHRLAELQVVPLGKAPVVQVTRLRIDLVGAANADAEIEVIAQQQAEPCEGRLVVAAIGLEQLLLAREGLGPVADQFLLVLLTEEEVGLVAQVRQLDPGTETHVEVPAVVLPPQRAHRKAASGHAAAILERALASRPGWCRAYRRLRPPRPRRPPPGTNRARGWPRAQSKQPWIASVRARMNEEGTARSEAPVGRRQPVGASRRMIRPAGRGP